VPLATHALDSHAVGCSTRRAGSRRGIAGWVENSWMSGCYVSIMNS
jgi:hypothetical protein